MIINHKLLCLSVTHEQSDMQWWHHAMIKSASQGNTILEGISVLQKLHLLLGLQQ